MHCPIVQLVFGYYATTLGTHTHPHLI